MEHMDVEDGSDGVGGTLDDECTVASPPLLPEEASSAMAIELGEGLGASAPGDDDGARSPKSGVESRARIRK